MAKITIKDEWTAEGKQLKKALEELAKLECFIGYQRGEKSEDGVDMCDIAAWNELGTSRGIPSRPFIRNTVDLHADDINKRLDSCVKMIMKGKTAEEALKKMGLYLKQQVQKEITDGSFAPNSPATIKKKGSDHPLIDTGQLRNSVNFKIQPKGEGTE